MEWMSPMEFGLRCVLSPINSASGLDIFHATKEALRYRSALQRGFLSLKDRPLCTATAVEICRTLKGIDMDIRRTPGTQLANDRTGELTSSVWQFCKADCGVDGHTFPLWVSATWGGA